MNNPCIVPKFNWINKITSRVPLNHLKTANHKVRKHGGGFQAYPRPQENQKRVSPRLRKNS